MYRVPGGETMALIGTVWVICDHSLGRMTLEVLDSTWDSHAMSQKSSTYIQHHL